MFTGGLNWYRSMDLKWKQRKPLRTLKVMFQHIFSSENDVDLKGFHGEDPISLLRKQFPNLRAVEMVSKAGHLVQLEKSDEVNASLVNFIRDIQENLGKILV